MGVRSGRTLFWLIYLWILSGSLLSGFRHKRLVDSPSSNHTKTCPDCKAPVFGSQLSNQTVVEGGRAVFRCYVSGKPEPNVTWYRNGKLIRNRSGSFTIVSKSWGVKLKIRPVKLSDEGAYSCVANNSEGTVSKQVFLTVTEATSPPLTAHSSSTTMTPFTDQELLPDNSKQSNPPDSKPKHGQLEEWTHSDLDIPTSPLLPETGSCVPYNGSVCYDLLKGRSIYVRSFERLENIERKVSRAYANIRKFEKISVRCRPFVKPLLCHYQFPSCDSSSSVPKPRQICYEECEILRTSICPEEYLISKRLTLQQVLFPECSSLPRADTAEGKNCIKLNVNKTKTTKTPKSPKSPNPPKPEKPSLEKGVVRREKALPVTGCYTGTGQNFNASVSVTEKGLVCQAWNSTTPHFHILSPKDHPEIGGGHNYCRNPGGQKVKPWCFTTDENTEFDYCNIPRCEETPPVEVVSILYMVIPCLVFGIVFSLVVIFICWRCHKQIIYQAGEAAATPLVPVIGKPLIKEMRRETVRFLKDLGEGEFGKLYRGEVVEKGDGDQTTRPILAKILRNSSSSNNRESFLRQAETWSKFSHPNVISIIGVCYNGPPTCILYECVEYGSLYDYLVDNSPLESPDEDDDDPETLSYYEQLSIAIQVAAGMNYISQHNYIHGDLAARNCMVGPRMTVKITDVALSRNPFSSDYYRSANRPPMPLRWMAPEGVLNYRFTVETDIWSFGVVLWEIFSFGTKPHFGFTDDEVMERIREHVLLPCPSDCPNSVFVLMTECWDILPPSRPRFSTIYTHLCALRWDTNGPPAPIESNERDCIHVEV
ncbi:Inactive tyrosine-protein kinase transmembrane receptor ror1 [Porites harrisoni]